MSENSQLRGHPVVPHSRRCRSPLGLTLVAAVAAALAGPLPAAAAPGAAAPAEAMPAPRPIIHPERRTYRTALAISYALAPLAAIAVGHGLAELEAADTTAVLVGATTLLAPAVFHIGYGNVGHGLAAFPEMLALTGLGVFIGGGAGYFIDAASCTSDGDECDFAGLTGLAVGALLGGVAAYTAYAIYDVSENAVVIGERSNPARPSVQLWLAPTRSEPRKERASTPTWTGLELGARLTF